MGFVQGEVIGSDDGGFKIGTFSNRVGVEGFISSVEVKKKTRVVKDILMVDCTLEFGLAALSVEV